MFNNAIESAKNFFDLESFKEWSINALVELEKRVTLLAFASLALISLMAAYLLYRRYDVKNRITIQNKEENKSIARDLNPNPATPHLKIPQTPPSREMHPSIPQKTVQLPKSVSDTHLTHLLRAQSHSSHSSPHRFSTLHLQSHCRSSLGNVRKSIKFEPQKDAQLRGTVNEIVRMASNPQMNKGVEPPSNEPGQMVEHSSSSSSVTSILHSSQPQGEYFNDFWQQANIFYLEERYEEAEEAFERALKENPSAGVPLSYRGYGGVLCILADELDENGQPNEAEEKYKRALSLNPNHSFVMQAYVNFLLGFEDDEAKKQEVLIWLRKILEIDPSKSTLDCFESELTGQPLSVSDQELIQRSKATIEKNTCSIPVCFAESLYQQGEYLLQLLRAEEQHDRKQPISYMAALKFKEALKETPSNDFVRWGYAEALLELALCYLLKAQCDPKAGICIPAAVIYSDHAMKMAPRHPLANLIFEKAIESAKEYYDQKGIYLEQDLYRSSNELRGKEENPNLLSKYAQTLFENGMYHQAFANFKKVLKIQPSILPQIGDALDELRYILAPLSDFEES